MRQGLLQLASAGRHDVTETQHITAALHPARDPPRPPKTGVVCVQMLIAKLSTASKTGPGLMNDEAAPDCSTRRRSFLEALSNSLMYSHDILCLRSNAANCLHSSFWQTSSVLCIVFCSLQNLLHSHPGAFAVFGKVQQATGNFNIVQDICTVSVHLQI